DLSRLRKFPILGRKNNGPEFRRGAVELKGYGEEIPPRLIDAHHTATLLHAGLRVHQNHRLTHQELCFQFHQTAVRVDDQRVSVFLDLSAVSRLSENPDGYLQHHTFAAAAIARIRRGHKT